MLTHSLLWLRNFARKVKSAPSTGPKQPQGAERVQFTEEELTQLSAPDRKAKPTL